MALSSETNRNAYIGNGAVDTYAYGFRIIDDDDLLVVVSDTSTPPVETTLVKTTDYTVTGVGQAAGGNVVLVNSAQSWLDGDGDLKTNYDLIIVRRVALTQTTDIRNQGDFYPEVHENAFDKLTMIDQQQQDAIDRAMLLPETVPAASFANSLPTDIAGTVSRAIVTNAAGDGWADAADWPTADEISNASASAIAAAASASSASTSAGTATTQAAAASASASAASTSATTASTQAGLAATARAAAETAETNAETAETNAETAEANAETAQAAAELAEGNAETAASNASTSASTATTQAGIATTQAGIATTKAGEANTSAIAALASEVAALASQLAAAASAAASGFTTGDAKITIKTVADTGFVMMDDGTIGNASSGATTRANADTASLYALLWNNVADAYAAVSTGRGANAAADYAANKTIALTKQLGRALIFGGSGSGLTARSLGQTGGAETVTLDATTMPAHTHVQDAHTHTQNSHTHGPASGNSFTLSNDGTTADTASAGANSFRDQGVATLTAATTPTNQNTTGVNQSTGTGGAHANMPPFSAWNIMIKL